MRQLKDGAVAFRNDTGGWRRIIDVGHFADDLTHA